MNFSLKFLRELFVQFIWMIPVHTILGKVELLDNLFIWIGEHIINDNVTYFVFVRPCVFEFEYSSLKPNKSAPAEVPITPLPQRHHRLSTRGNMKDKV